MFKGLVLVVLLGATFSLVKTQDPVELLPGEFVPGYLPPGESLIYQIILTEEELNNRTVTLGILTSDKEYLEEDEEFGTNLTVALTREFPNDTSIITDQAHSLRGVAFWPSRDVTAGTYYVIVANLQQFNASFNVTYLLLSDTQFQLNEPVQEALTPLEIIYFHVIINHTENVLFETTAVRFDLTLDSLTPILDENSVERLLTISQGDYPTPSRHFERAIVATETQFLNEQNQTVYRLTLYEEISLLDYMNMTSTMWILGFYNTAEYELQTTFTVTLIDRSPGALDQTDDLTLFNNRRHMLRLFYFVTPDTMPEALVYFEVTMPRALLPSETITLTFFNTLLLDVNNSVTYELNSSDATTEYFVAGRQDQSVASRDYAVSIIYTGPEISFGNVSVTPRYMEVYSLPLFNTQQHNVLANREVLFEISVDEGSLPFLRDNRISTIFHLALNVAQTDINVRIQLRQNRLPTPLTRDISYESSVEDLFLELDRSRSLVGKWYAVVDVEDTNETSLTYSIVASFQNRFDQTLGTNITNDIQPDRWHYYKMAYNAVDNQGVFFDLSYVNRIEGFVHEITREINFFVSNETDIPFPTFGNHVFASRLYWPRTENFADGTIVTTRQSVYVPASSFAAGGSFMLYTGLFVAPDSTQVNHTYEFMATGIREYVLGTSTEHSVNGHTWVYFTHTLQTPTLVEAPSRYVGEIHLTSMSNFVANVSVALSEGAYPAFPPFGDNVRDIDIYGELSHFAPVTGEGLIQLAVRNWGPITMRFTIDTAVHIETPVTLPINATQLNIAPKQYHFFSTTRLNNDTNTNLYLTINSAGNKRSAEQSGNSFVVLMSNNGEFPAISDFVAESSSVTGQRFETGSGTFEATSTLTTVVFAIYNEGTAPLQATMSALLQEPVAPISLPPLEPPLSSPPLADAPIQSPVSPIEPPVDAPVQDPISAPVVEPVDPPLAAPIEPPVTEPIPVPVAAPILPPVPSPIQPPVAAPIQVPYAQAPVAQSPVAVPFNAPVGKNTPVTLVVEAPSGDKPMHPLYILLIVAGGLAVVGVAVAIIIKMVQSSRKKKTSLSGLEYVELVDESKRF